MDIACITTDIRKEKAMANYRTVKELKPHNGWDITRVHTNGFYRYIAKANIRGQEYELEDHSLTGLKKAINWTSGKHWNYGI